MLWKLCKDPKDIEKHNEKFAKEISWLKKEFPSKKYNEFWIYADFYLGSLKIYGHRDCFTDVGGPGVARGQELIKVKGNFKNGYLEGKAKQWGFDKLKGTIEWGFYEEGNWNGQCYYRCVDLEEG